MSATANCPPIEITRFAKTGGPLTKRISLSDAGAIVSDGSACIMSHGTAHREQVQDLQALASLIAGLDSHEAIALGALRGDLPDQVEVVTKAALAKPNGTVPLNLIARTSDFIRYSVEIPALALVDFDRRAMPPLVAERIERLGGYRGALLTVLPELARAAGATRSSTSSGLFRVDTGERLVGSGGAHWFVEVQDGADVERFLRTLHSRCWLAGFGWMMTGACEQLLERSIVDRMVYAAERLVFEGAPVPIPPLAQDQAQRKPEVQPGWPIHSKESHTGRAKRNSCAGQMARSGFTASRTAAPSTN